jgi:hypothetical protein
MRRTEIAVGAIAVFAFVLGATTPAHAVSKCTAAKLKAAGKNIWKGLKCDAKAEATGTAGYGEICEARPDLALATAFGKAERKGTCDGDAPTVHDLIETCETSAISAVGASDGSPTKSKCDAKKIKAMGKKAKRKLRCLSKQAAKGTDPTLCLSNADSKFSTAIGKLVLATDCSNTSTAAALETVVDDNCVTPIRDLIFPPACTPTDFTFTMNSSGGSAFHQSRWPGGTDTQGSANCGVTVNRPSGKVTTVGRLGDQWTIASWTPGFALCILTGGCVEHGAYSVCTNCDGVDTPSKCPPLGIADCTSNRPSCTTGLNGNATDTAHVQCVP